MVEDAEEKKATGRNKKLGKTVSHPALVVWLTYPCFFRHFEDIVHFLIRYCLCRFCSFWPEDNKKSQDRIIIKYR